jgi:very-short-patch-repair endonuclease
MPVKHKGYCQNCKRYFEGYKKQYCSVTCRVAKTGKERAKTMWEKNVFMIPKNFDVVELDTMYNRQKMSVKDISLVLGHSRNATQNLLTKCGFKLRSMAEQLSIQNKGVLKDSNWGKRVSEAIQKYGHPMQGKHISPASIQKRKITIEANGGVHWTDQQRKRASKTWKQKMVTDSDYLKKRAERMAIKPNKPETILINLLKEMRLPYIYTGDYKFWLEGKNPDFLNCNGQKKIIDIFGKHWHTEEEVVKRKFLFGQYGYDTLILWDYELKNLDEVKQKLLEFDQKIHA